MPKYKGSGGSIHEIDPETFGTERLEYQIARGVLVPVADDEAVETIDAGGTSRAGSAKPRKSEPAAEPVDELVAELDAMTMPQLAEYVAELGLPAELAEITPKPDRVAAMAAAIREAEAG